MTIMRIKFEDDSLREEFFNLIKSNSKKRWVDIGGKLRVPRQTFDRYRSGKQTMPEKLFLSLLNYISEKEQRNIINKTIKLQDNFGQVKGGKKAYLINIKKFDEG